MWLLLKIMLLKTWINYKNIQCKNVSDFGVEFQCKGYGFQYEENMKTLEANSKSQSDYAIRVSWRWPWGSWRGRTPKRVKNWAFNIMSFFHCLIFTAHLSITTVTMPPTGFPFLGLKNLWKGGHSLQVTDSEEAINSPVLSHCPLSHPSTLASPSQPSTPPSSLLQATFPLTLPHLPFYGGKSGK